MRRSPCACWNAGRLMALRQAGLRGLVPAAESQAPEGVPGNGHGPHRRNDQRGVWETRALGLGAALVDVPKPSGSASPRVGKVASRKQNCIAPHPEEHNRGRIVQLSCSSFRALERVANRRCRGHERTLPQNLQRHAQRCAAFKMHPKSSHKPPVNRWAAPWARSISARRRRPPPSPTPGRRRHPAASR